MVAGFLLAENSIGAGFSPLGRTQWRPKTHPVQAENHSSVVLVTLELLHDVVFIRWWFDCARLCTLLGTIKPKKMGIHPLNRKRRVHGEYHHLFKKLRHHNDRFFQYMRMSENTFDYVLEKVHNLSITFLLLCNLFFYPILGFVWKRPQLNFQYSFRVWCEAGNRQEKTKFSFR